RPDLGKIVIHQTGLFRFIAFGRHQSRRNTVFLAEFAKVFLKHAASHYRRGFARPIVGDVEEVTDLVKQPPLSLLPRDVLADDHHPIDLAAGRRLAVEFRHVLTTQLPVLEAAGDDDGLLGELSALPASLPADGLTNRDHDRILYGSEK